MIKKIAPLFLLVYIRKRIDLKVFESLTNELICKEYLNVSKMKRKPEKVFRRGFKLQINYLKRNNLMKWLYTNVMKMREEIILTFKPAQRNLGLI